MFPQAGCYLLLGAITFPLHHPQAEVTVLGGYFKGMSQQLLQLYPDLQPYREVFLQSLTAAVEVCISFFPFSHAMQQARDSF